MNGEAKEEMNEELSAGCDIRAAALQCSLARNSHLIQRVMEPGGIERRVTKPKAGKTEQRQTHTYIHTSILSN